VKSIVLLEIFVCELPSVNQTWQWEIPELNEAFHGKNISLSLSLSMIYKMHHFTGRFMNIMKPTFVAIPYVCYRLLLSHTFVDDEKPQSLVKIPWHPGRRGGRALSAALAEPAEDVQVPSYGLWEWLGCHANMMIKLWDLYIYI